MCSTRSTRYGARQAELPAIAPGDDRPSSPGVTRLVRSIDRLLALAGQVLADLAFRRSRGEIGAQLPRIGPVDPNRIYSGLDVIERAPFVAKDGREVPP